MEKKPEWIYIKTPIASKWFILEKGSFDKSFLKLNSDWNNILKRPNRTKDGDITRFFSHTNLKGIFLVHRHKYLSQMVHAKSLFWKKEVLYIKLNIVLN